MYVFRKAFDNCSETTSEKPSRKASRKTSWNLATARMAPLKTTSEAALS